MKRIQYLLLIVSVCCLTACSISRRRPHRTVDPSVAAHYLLISKEQMRLSVVDSLGEVVARYPIACGEFFGNKERSGDRKTPEGLFWVEEILETAAWSYDFGDGKGQQSGAYGPYFIRLHTPPHTGIGIHGTQFDHSIGTRSSAGCVRMHNRDLMELIPYVRVGMPVFITPAYADEQ